MINVLVLGVGGNVSQGIIKALRKSNLEMHLIGACISPMSTGLYMCDEAFVSPYASADDFMDWLITICNTCKVDIILTGVEENIRKIAEHIEELRSRTKAIFISSTYEQLQIGQDKYATCQWLQAHGCHYPEYCDLANMEDSCALAARVGYPLIAKPWSGKSAHGIYVIEDEAMLKRLAGLKHYVLQECVGDADSEYTVGCYADRKGTLQDIIIMHRILKNGTTVYAEVLEHDAIRREAEKICHAYQPGGPLNIQMRLDKTGRPVCFELNVRFSGTTAMRANFGYRDVEAMIKEYVLQQPIDDCFQVRPGEAFRYDNEMYLFGGATREMREKLHISDMKRYEIYDEK